MDRYTFTNRYLLIGTLEMKTALHIGGGRVTLSGSDSPVVLTPEQIPFIPGSSFKGLLRSTVEKLVPTLPGSLFSCALIELSKEEIAEERKQNKRLCSTVLQQEIRDTIREHPDQREKLLRDARSNCCHTCQLFGSPFAAARIAINDLSIPEGTWSSMVQQRDGVAIDRDSGKAKDRLKYDFEVVPASTEFQLEMTLENATDEDLQLLSIGLSEFIHGFAPIGGKRTRGLGACQLKGLHVSELVLDLEKIDENTRNRRLRDYLLRRAFSHEYDNGEAFLEGYISSLFESASR